MNPAASMGAALAQPYTGPGRTRPTPQSERSGGRGGTRHVSLALSSAGAGNNTGLVPGARPHGCSGPYPWSQAEPPPHLPAGENTLTREGQHRMRRVHGELNTYVNGRCRCPLCSAASAEYARTRTRLRAYGRIKELVDPEVVQGHLRWLSGNGIGADRAAELAGISRSTTRRILCPGAVSRGVTPRVAHALLAVVPTLDNACDNARVDATGTRRRLQALAFAGWSMKSIQDELGIVRLDRVLRHDTVTARVARLVRTFYDTRGAYCPPTNSSGAHYTVRTRVQARLAGYLPALAWDDETIDDPTATPCDASLRHEKPRTQIHLEDVLELVSAGADWNELEARTGGRRNTIEQALNRAGRNDLITRITRNRWLAA